MNAEDEAFKEGVRLGAEALYLTFYKEGLLANTAEENPRLARCYLEEIQDGLERSA